MEDVSAKAAALARVRKHCTQYVAECPNCSKQHWSDFKSQFAQCSHCKYVFRVDGWRVVSADEEPPVSQVACECGATKLKLPKHSDWCPAKEG